MALEGGWFAPPLAGQRFFAPEVVQTSAMDCGPAALKSILEGFGIRVSYGRLREACQTDVDGTSINTVEDIAGQLGLAAEQVMLPADHVALPEAQALPAIVVVQRPNGLTHFLVAWGRVGGLIQVMDPATGRRWPTLKRFQDELYIHTFPVPVEAWREWAGSDGLLAPLRRRMRALKLGEAQIERLAAGALADPGWRGLATLDAAVRMVSALAQARGVIPGEQAGRVLEKFYTLNLAGPLPRVDKSGGVPPAGVTPAGGAPHSLMIPAVYWSVLPAVETQAMAGGEQPLERLLLRGAVMVRILGAHRAPGAAPAAEAEPGSAETAGQDESGLEWTPGDAPDGEAAPSSTGGAQPGVYAPAALPPDLQAALKEKSARPEQEIWKALRSDGLFTPLVLLLALFLATLGVTIEALLFQGMIRIGQNLNLTGQRILAGAALLSFVLAMLYLEFPISATVLRMGRRLETRLRIAFLEKVPRLGDRYFRSRLTSDMTQRAYDLRALRGLPGLGVGMARTAFQLLLTLVGVIWLDPISAPLAILGTLFFVGLSYASRPLLEERDLRMRTHTGALAHFYLDALLGLTPIRTHGAERAMRRQHESQLYEWVRTGRENYTLAALMQGLGSFFYSLFSILIILNYLAQGGQASEILLLFYWTLSLPALGQSLAAGIQQYPMQRNLVLRLLEPLSAPDEEEAWAGPQESPLPGMQPLDSQVGELSETAPAAGPAIEIQDVTLQAGGHTILSQVTLRLAPGEHIGIVGPSGAGKSSLVGLLLGWHRPSQGCILVDGRLLDGARLQRLRRETAWVDPAVQLWNRSLYDNLRYGSNGAETHGLGEMIQAADLYDVLERLPDGLKTDLGEGGGLVSGGEGQRVRLGRAMLRPGVRLVVLDEPFRGLDREKRRLLLAEARRHWQAQTLLCITHDVGETLTLPRVLVIENGLVIEDGDPQALAADPASRYRALLEAEDAVRRDLWAGAGWRRLWIKDGRLQEQ
ncbi:MAG: ATP-binding cassette domain-containing protein [Chloroflexota bacterium]